MPMDYNEFHLASVASVGTLIQVYPTPDYEERNLNPARHERGQTGGLFTFVISGPGAYEVSLPLTFVTSAQRLTFTNWWRTGEEVVLFWNASGTPQYVIGRLTGDVEPLGGWDMTSPLRRRGVLQLKDSRGVGRYDGRPFILDSTSYGLLGGLNNRLI